MNAKTFLLLIVVASFSAPAWAYLDPSTGSMIVSAIVGLFATLGLAIKTYWYKLKSLFRRDSVDATSADRQGEAQAEAAADKEPTQRPVA